MFNEEKTSMAFVGQGILLNQCLINICNNNLYPAIILGYIIAQRNYAIKKGYKNDLWINCSGNKLLQMLSIKKSTLCKAIKYLENENFIITRIVGSNKAKDNTEYFEDGTEKYKKDKKRKKQCRLEGYYVQNLIDIWRQENSKAWQKELKRQEKLKEIENLNNFKSVVNNDIFDDIINTNTVKW